MSHDPSWHPDTVCVHAGVEPEPQTGAIMTPIFQTSTYVQPAPGQPILYDYSRGGNPTRTALESALAGIEGGKHAFTFSSGLAAEQAVLQALEPGAKVLVSEDVYGGTGRLFRRLFARYGFHFEFLDLTDLAAVEAAADTNTKLIWVETPTNPLLRVVDIEAMAKIANRVGAILAVDNTFASPALQSPLRLGAHLVVHSTTKYIGGHSDLIGGALVTNDDELAEKLKFVQFAAGAVNSPFESFLLLRSLKTLGIRMERHSHNALALARTLEVSGHFTQVIYPGLESHPQHAIAKKQMKAYSGIVSVRLDRDLEGVTRFVKGLRIFSLAESLGGVESLVNHPELMTHASVPPELRRKLGIDVGLLRLSVGIEDVGDLVADVKQALER